MRQWRLQNTLKTKFKGHQVWCQHFDKNIFEIDFVYKNCFIGKKVFIDYCCKKMIIAVQNYYFLSFPCRAILCTFNTTVQKISTFREYNFKFKINFCVGFSNILS